MIYGYARVSTDGQSVAAQVSQLKAAGCEKVFREVASGAKTNRNQLCHAVEHARRSKVASDTSLPTLQHIFVARGSPRERAGPDGRGTRELRSKVIEMVGAVGIEPTTS
jgi:Resolvase, N terminal domain